MGNIEKAITNLEELAEEGYRDNNLYVNLVTYYLIAGELTKAKKFIDEAPVTDILPDIITISRILSEEGFLLRHRLKNIHNQTKWRMAFKPSS